MIRAGSAVGFTGTQKGCTAAQLAVVRELLWDGHGCLTAGVAHLGDCIGVDEEMWRLCVELGVRTVGHPPLNGAKRAWCVYDSEWPAKGYMERNHDIVACSELLVVVPFESSEQLRSGTWATWRQAGRVGVPWVLVLPDGTVQQSDTMKVWKMSQEGVE